VNNAQVKDEKKQLKRHLKNAEVTLRDVQNTVRMVEKNRAKFLDIDDDELFDRKRFTEVCKNRINQAKDGMNSQSIKTKLLKDQRSLTKRRLGLSNNPSLEETEEMTFIQNNHASAQLMMEQQDEALDELDGAVTRVSHMAENIHEELGHQNKMLNELEDDLQNAEEQLGLVMGKLAKVLKTKSRCQLGTILTLSVVVVVLFFLVIYT
jgi:syntaxin 6